MLSYGDGHSPVVLMCVSRSKIGLANEETRGVVRRFSRSAQKEAVAQIDIADLDDLAGDAYLEDEIDEEEEAGLGGESEDIDADEPVEP